MSGSQSTVEANQSFSPIDSARRRNAFLILLVLNALVFFASLLPADVYAQENDSIPSTPVTASATSMEHNIWWCSAEGWEGDAREALFQHLYNWIRLVKDDEKPEQAPNCHVTDGFHLMWDHTNMQAFREIEAATLSAFFPPSYDTYDMGLSTIRTPIVFETISTTEGERAIAVKVPGNIFFKDITGFMIAGMANPSMGGHWILGEGLGYDAYQFSAGNDFDINGQVTTADSLVVGYNLTQPTEDPNAYVTIAYWIPDDQDKFQESSLYEIRIVLTAAPGYVEPNGTVHYATVYELVAQNQDFAAKLFIPLAANNSLGAPATTASQK